MNIIKLDFFFLISNFHLLTHSLFAAQESLFVQQTDCESQGTLEMMQSPPKLFFFPVWETDQAVHCPTGAAGRHFSQVCCRPPLRDDPTVFQGKASCCGKSGPSRAVLHNRIILHLLPSSAKGILTCNDNSCGCQSFHVNVLFTISHSFCLKLWGRPEAHFVYNLNTICCTCWTLYILERMYVIRILNIL